MKTEARRCWPDAPTQTTCEAVARTLIGRRWMLATAESCTGGLISATCTDLAGSSAWFERGFVTYSNASKTELLGVDAALIEQHGAVSQAVVAAMTLGALAHSRAQVALAVTGVAGPDGGTADKPVGTVWFGWAWPGHEVVCEPCCFLGDRHQVRAATVQHALVMLAHWIGLDGLGLTGIKPAVNPAGRRLHAPDG